MTVAIVMRSLWMVYSDDLDIYATWTPVLGSVLGWGYFQVAFRQPPWTDDGSEMVLEWRRQTQGGLLPGYRQMHRPTSGGRFFPSPQGAGLHVTLQILGYTQASMSFAAYLRYLFGFTAALNSWKQRYAQLAFMVSPAPGANLLWRIDIEVTESAKTLFTELWCGGLDGELSLNHGSTLATLQAAGAQFVPFSRGGILHMTWK
jgi:hypothetical protein